MPGDADDPRPLELARRVVIALLVVLACGMVGCDSRPSFESPERQRIVSLSPALTETLFALGAGKQVVGVSDYCEYPDAAKRLPRTGTSITPNFEAIARLAPSLIVSEQAINTRGDSLKPLGEPVLLPWLSLSDVVAGIERLGRLTGKTEEGVRLSRRLSDTLSVPAPVNGPRVLLVLGYGSHNLSEVWFVRQNSIHGAALAAAGGRNAVDRDIPGQPKLGLEQVIALEPDMIVVLMSKPEPSTNTVLSSWRKVSPLAAVKKNRLAVLRAPEAFSNGPRILRLVDRLRSTLADLALR